jgi:hypothetical protein
VSSNKSTGDFSLSLVDVVTNGLASVLVLFFLLTALRSHLSWSASGHAADSLELRAVDPVLILVTADSEHGTFTADSPWISQAGVLGIVRTHGTSYATFYAAEPPTEPVELKLPDDRRNCRIRVFHGKRQWEPQIGDEPIVRVWPPPPSPGELAE